MFNKTILPPKTQNAPDVCRVAAFSQDRSLCGQPGRPRVFPQTTSELPLIKQKQ